MKQEKIEKVNNIDVLVISNKYDFTTDYICIELKKRGISYLRLNKDCFHNYKVDFNINSEELIVEVNSNKNLINGHLKAVYYRAPTYFRETYLKKFSTEKQLYNSQWMSFIRNLTIFENAKWMNNPIDTYKAENKLLQLKYAKSVGFNIPYTLVTNNNVLRNIDNNIVVKSIDTALFTIDNNEAFFYTTILSSNELNNFDISLFPLTIQNNLEPKLDYRITLAGKELYSTMISDNGRGVSGDWRKQKDSLKFTDCDIPDTIKEKCFALLNKFNLSFGGIDLIKHNNDFYFIEINPTGEWAWLVDTAKQKIYEGICDYLT